MGLKLLILLLFVVGSVVPIRKHLSQLLVKPCRASIRETVAKFRESRESDLVSEIAKKIEAKRGLLEVIRHEVIILNPLLGYKMEFSYKITRKAGFVGKVFMISNNVNLANHTYKGDGESFKAEEAMTLAFDDFFIKF